MAQIVNDPIAAPPLREPLLERRFELGRIDPELVAYGLLFLLSIFMHFLLLGQMAMAHDESIHAWMSWKFFTGRGGFNCAGGRSAATYCYDPVYHGPTLYFLTLASYFLFGDGNATARLPQTLAGIALVPGCYLLRPVFGKRPAFFGAVLATLSPSMLYFARYARHDALILLWTLLLVAGLFLWLQNGKTGSLALASASLALAWATHELVFILIFIVGTFLIFRLFWEWRPGLFVALAAGGLVLAVAVATAETLATPETQAYKALHLLLGPALLGGTGALMTLLLTRSWPSTPVLTDRLRTTWATRANADPDRPRTFAGNIPPALLWAAGTFLLVFGLLFSTFLAYPRGFLDGWYQGIKYWWGSQQTFARGQQPWYYYLMLLPIYELMALLFALGGIVMLGLGRRRAAAPRVPPSWDGQDGVEQNLGFARRDGDEDGDILEHRAGARIYPAAAGGWLHDIQGLFVSFLAYWSVLSFIAFSWAGEKMPWLLIHIALPVTLLAAWVLSELVDGLPWRTIWQRKGWSVPLLVIAALVLAGVAAYYLSGGGVTQAAFRDRLRALPALAMFGAALFALLTVGAQMGTHTLLRLAALTVAGVLLLYGIRAAVQVVYLHPDTPIEPLIYTQTAPDVPVIVDQIRQVAINQTRNDRTKDDPTGGLSMKVTIDNALAWPFQWYLRDFRDIKWCDVKQQKNCDFDAPIVLVHTPNLSDTLRERLTEEHVRTAEGVLNWWFPENGTPYDASKPGQTGTRAYKDLRNEGPWAVLSWPFRPSNWPVLAKFMLYREIPQKLDGRDLEVYMARDLLPGGGGAAAQPAIPSDPLVAQSTIGMGQLAGPRGVTTDASGKLYVADSLNHRVAIFDAAGTLLKTIGAKGSGDGQLNEPSGVAVDADGNLYIADTWNARIAKFGPDGRWIKAWGVGRDDFGDGRRATDNKGDPQANAANPLGFFGPRNVLVAGDRVYIADTGNKRIVVTDRNGAFVEQFGTFGQQLGQLNEPIGLAVDKQGRIYVGDTWNGRIQIFTRNASGGVMAAPQQVVKVSGWDKDTYNDPYLAVAPDGRMLVSLAGRNAIGVYNTAGALERRIKGDPKVLSIPKGLTIGPDGAAYVVDGGGKALRFRLP
jgi:uncharacterized protein (TIGR03663 family)